MIRSPLKSFLPICLTLVSLFGADSLYGQNSYTVTAFGGPSLPVIVSNSTAMYNQHAKLGSTLGLDVAMINRERLRLGIAFSTTKVSYTTEYDYTNVDMASGKYLISIDHNIIYHEVSLLVGHTIWSSKKANLVFSPGILASHASKSDQQATYTYNQTEDWSRIRRLIFGTQMGLGLEWQMSDLWHLKLEPRYRIYTKSHSKITSDFTMQFAPIIGVGYHI